MYVALAYIIILPTSVYLILVAVAKIFIVLLKRGLKIFTAI